MSCEPAWQGTETFEGENQNANLSVIGTMHLRVGSVVSISLFSRLSSGYIFDEFTLHSRSSVESSCILLFTTLHSGSSPPFLLPEIAHPISTSALFVDGLCWSLLGIDA